MLNPHKLVNGDGSESRQNEQVARSKAECQSRSYVHDDCLSNPNISLTDGEGVSPPTVLVLSTNNSSQSYVEAGELLTFDEFMECEAENFAEYLDELAEKAILLRQRENPERGLIVKPSDRSRYFPGGKRKAKKNIRTRFGVYYKASGTFVTLTYDHKQFSRWDAWLRLPEDLKRFKHDIVMRYVRAGRSSPKYISVIEEQSITGYPHVHLFYPGLHWLLKKEDVQALWGVGRTRVEYSKGVNVGGYVCKYITKMGGWSEEALAFIWKYKIRLYSYSRCYKLPAIDKQASEWAFFINTTRTRIENNLSLIIKAIPNIENLADYLEDLPTEEVSQGRAKRGHRRALTNSKET
jgi:hypothetical protein